MPSSSNGRNPPALWCTGTGSNSSGTNKATDLYLRRGEPPDRDSGGGIHVRRRRQARAEEHPQAVLVHFGCVHCRRHGEQPPALAHKPGKGGAARALHAEAFSYILPAGRKTKMEIPDKR